MGKNQSCPAAERVKAEAEAKKRAEEQRRREEEQRRLDEEQKRREEDARRAQLQRESQARDKFKLGFSLWEEAWKLEESGQANAAAAKLNSARNYFLVAQNLHPQNAQYSNYSKLALYKIQGNAAFNDAIKLHDEANNLMGLGLYIEAMKKYNLASQKYRQGAKANQRDEIHRFNDCIDIVNGNIDSVMNAVRVMERTQQVKVLQQLRQLANEKQGAQVVNEKSNIDVVFQYLKDSRV